MIKERITMVKLSAERVDEILHKETGRTEELTTILRSIYTRYIICTRDTFPTWMR